jgi:hypothetical protein
LRSQRRPRLNFGCRFGNLLELDASFAIGPAVCRGGASQFWIRWSAHGAPPKVWATVSKPFDIQWGKIPKIVNQTIDIVCFTRFARERQCFQ